MRNHDNAKKEWTDEELKKLYETHERLLDLVSLFCYVPRAKYLPLGPTRYVPFMHHFSVNLEHLKFHLNMHDFKNSRFGSIMTISECNCVTET